MVRPVHQCPAVNTEGKSGGGDSSFSLCVSNGNNRDAQNPLVGFQTTASFLSLVCL